MNLHGESVNVGDVVYDIIDGTGTIASVSDTTNQIFVKIGRFTYPYDGNGKRLSHVPTRIGTILFWHNPLTFVPPKNEAGWLLMKGIGESLRTFTAGISND